MLTIREEQMAVFRAVHASHFENWMVAHLRQFFPGHCSSKTSSDLRDAVRDGIARAARYDITGQLDVCKFIGLQTVFGPGFDLDSRYAWAHSILSEASPASERLRALQRGAIDHLTGRRA